MKKFLNFLLLILLASAASNVWAYDVTLMTDGTTKVKDGVAWIGGTEHSISIGLNTFSASNKNLMVRGNSNNSTFNVVKNNGANVSKSGNGNGLSPNSYNCTLSGDLILIEVYASRSASNPYEYPLNISIADADGSHVKSITTSTGKSYSASTTSINFIYNETITVTLDKEATEYGLTKGSDVSVGRSGSNWIYTFTPFPAPTTPTFTLTIPGDNQQCTLNTEGIDNLSQVLGYKIKHKDNTETLIDRVYFDGSYIYGETITVYFKGSPSVKVDGVAANVNSNDSYKGTSCKSATFTPGMNSSLEMKFNPYSFQTQIDDNNFAECVDYFLGYQVVHDDNSVQDLTMNLSQGWWENSFANGDIFHLYLSVIPESVYANSEEVNYVINTEKIPGENVYEYIFSPANNANCRIKFGSTSVIVPGETFTLTVNVDRANQILASVYTKAGRCTSSELLPAGNSTLDCEIDDGYILFSLADPANCVFRSFDGSGYEKTLTTIGNGTYTEFSMLSYGTGQIDPVKIKSSIATSDEASISYETYGTFNIRTLPTSEITWYELTLNITDTTNNLDVSVGPSSTTNSSANRTVSDLHVGANTIRFNEYDAFVNISRGGGSLTGIHNISTSWNTSILANSNTQYSVRVNKAVTQNGEDTYVFNPESVGGTITVTNYEPVTGDKQFTFTVDHAEYINRLARFTPTTTVVDGETITTVSSVDITTIQNDENTLEFSDGQYFRLFPEADHTPESVKMGTTDIPLELGMYEFTPTDGCTVTVTFGEPQVIVRPTFIVITDSPSDVYQIFNDVTDETFTITDSPMEIPFNNSNELFKMRLLSDDVLEVSFDDVPLNKNGFFYEFYPQAGKILKVFFSQEVAPPTTDPTFELYVDEPAKITRIYDAKAEEDLDITLVEGKNLIAVSEGLYRVCVSEEATSFTFNGSEISADTDEDWGIFYDIEAPTAETVVNVVFARVPSFTLLIDDASKASCSAGSIVSGANRFEFELGQTFTVTPADGNAALAVTIDGSAVPFLSGKYTFTPARDSEVRVFFNYVPDQSSNKELKLVKVSFTNDGTEDIFNFAKIERTAGHTNENNEWVPGVDDEFAAADIAKLTGGILVPVGTSINFNYDNHNFEIASITVNGNQATNSGVYTGAYNFSVSDNTVINFDVTRAQVINYTIVTDHPEHFFVYKGDDNTQIIALDNPYAIIEGEGEDMHVVEVTNQYRFVTNSLDRVLHITRNPEQAIMFSSVSDNFGNSYTAVEGTYTIELQDGMVITVATADVEYNDVVIVYLDIRDDEATDFHIENTASLSGQRSGRTISTNMSNGRHIIKYNKEYDGNLFFRTSIIPATLHTYVCGDEIQTAEETLNQSFIIDVEGVYVDVQVPIVRAFFRDQYKVETVNEVNGEGELTGEQHEENKEVDVKVDDLQHDVEFAIAEDFKPNTEDAAIVFLRDEGEIIYTDDENHHAIEFYGTWYHLYGRVDNNGDLLFGFHVHIEKVNSSDSSDEPEAQPAPAKVPAYAEAKSVEELYVPDAPEGFKYINSFPINYDSKITINPNEDGTLTGVEDVIANTQENSCIYDMYGRTVKVEASAADLRSLPVGIYIFRGHKILVK